MVGVPKEINATLFFKLQVSCWLELLCLMYEQILVSSAIAPFGSDTRAHRSEFYSLHHGLGI